MEEFVEHARRYSELGWALTRLRGKVPIDRAWQSLKPQEPGATAGAWSQWGKRFNMGIVLGPSGLAVLEYDDERARGTFEQLVGDGLPPIVITGSGKRHAYYEACAGIAKVTRDGLELRVGSHQCVAPPSVHPETGMPYAWDCAPWERPPPPLPERIVEFFQVGRSTSLDRVIELGSRHDSFVHLAASMSAKGIGEPAILAALRGLNSEQTGGNPKPDAELVAIARDAMSWRVAGAAAEASQRVAIPEPSPFLGRTARAIYELGDRGLEDMLLGPLVVRGARTIIAGDTGHGKTVLSLRMAKAVLRGELFLDWQGAGADCVLVIDLEQGLRSVRRALEETGLHEAEDVIYEVIPDGLALDQSETEVAALETLIAERHPAVVILDPFYKAHRAADPNQERPVVELMRVLDRIRTEYRFALLLPAHPRKEQQSRGARKLTVHDVAGTGAITRGAEVVIAIERLAHGAARLRFLKDRDGDLPVGDTLALLYDRERGFRRGADESEEREAECLGWLTAYVVDHPGLARGKVEQAFHEAHGQRGRNLARRTIDRQLQGSDGGETPRLVAGLGSLVHGTYLYAAAHGVSPLAASAIGESGENLALFREADLSPSSPPPRRGGEESGESPSGRARTPARAAERRSPLEADDIPF